MIDPATISRGGLIAVGVVAVLVVVAVERLRGDRPLAAVRRRLLFGVPWGTLVVSAVVLAVYLFVQGGATNWFDPVVTPFRAWTYVAPLGVLLSGFAHAGPGHLIGNLVGTLTLAPLAEYVYAHYPQRRGASLSRPRHNPYVRAFLLFPAAVLVVGVATAVFSLGPVIGFSGVVFAFAGVALVRYPLGTVVALAAGDAVRTAWRALQNPVTVASGRPAFITPWWADIAIHGHALGLLFGVVAGGALAVRRGTALPPPRRLLAGTVLVAVSQALWAVYWFRGNGEFVLFRAAGLALVLLLAVLVTALSVGHVSGGDRHTPGLVRVEPRTDGSGSDRSGSDRQETDRQNADRPSHEGAPATTRDGSAGTSENGSIETSHEGPVGPTENGSIETSGGGSGGSRFGFSTASVALVVLILVTGLLAGAAIPTNLVTVGDQQLPGEPVEVRDYEVVYAENVENGMVSVVDIEGFGLSTSVETSGVIVRNPSRGIWTTAVSTGRLAFAGTQRVTVGGIGWRETIRVDRTGYTAAGGGTAYRVTITHDGDRQVAFRSESAQAEPTIAGWNVSVAVREDRFLLVVSRNDTTRTVGLPSANETVSAGPITFVRENRRVVAVVGNEENRTVVTIATEERYRGQRDD